MRKAKAQLVTDKWWIGRKKELNAERRKKASLGGDSLDDITSEIIYTGVTTMLYRTMTEVGANPLVVGHNFPMREILLLHVVEEVNIYGVHISIGRSNNFQFSAKGKHVHVSGSWGRRGSGNSIT